MKKRGSALESNSSTERSSDGEAGAGGSRGVVPPRIVVARLGKPNGLDGFLGLYVEPEDLVYFEDNSIVHIGDRPYTVRAVRRGKKGPQVAFAEVTSREQAEAIRGNEVFASERRDLAADEFWAEDLVDLEVRPGGGRVVAVNHGPGQDRLEIERDGVRFEVPFVAELVPVVEVEDGYIEIIEIEGLSEPSD